jgi:hypothetical protein
MFHLSPVKYNYFDWKFYRHFSFHKTEYYSLQYIRLEL